MRNDQDVSFNGAIVVLECLWGRSGKIHNPSYQKSMADVFMYI